MASVEKIQIDLYLLTYMNLNSKWIKKAEHKIRYTESDRGEIGE